MKKSFRLLALALPLLTLASCGTDQANLLGTYSSGRLSFVSTYPASTFKILTYRVQGINLYDDDTYMLSESTQSYSGGLNFDPTNSGDNDTSDSSDRGSTVAYYYGTYTSSEEEGLLSVTIEAPTHIVYSRTSSITWSAGFFDSANWTNEMGIALGSEEEPMTSEGFLEAYGYEQKSFTIDMTNCKFTYLEGINKSPF